MLNISVFPGDTLLVYPRPGNGTDEACEFGNEFSIKFSMKSGVVLMAANGPGTVCIRGSAGLEPGIFMVNTNESTTIDGMAITWDSTQNGVGGAVACFTAAGVIKNCIFRNCFARIGAGVYQFVSNVRLENNLFINNTCSGGGGVIALSTSTPDIVNNTLYGSSAPQGFPGAALYTTDSAFTLERNIFYGSVGGSAVYCFGSEPFTIGCNLFWNNLLGPFGGDCADATGTDGNVNANPGFCNESSFDFSVCATSPALNGPCGIIGYVPPEGAPGCASCPTASSANLTAESWGRIKSFYR
jgi:hypothetical protein